MPANKTTLTTKGTATLECGDGAQVRTQVGDVSKNLMSVAEMCDAGFDVIFSNTRDRRGAFLRAGREGVRLDADGEEAGPSIGFSLAEPQLVSPRMCSPLHPIDEDSSAWVAVRRNSFQSQLGTA